MAKEANKPSETADELIIGAIQENVATLYRRHSSKISAMIKASENQALTVNFATKIDKS